MERMLNVKELSEVLNLKPKTVYRQAEEGTIPAVKVGGALRFMLPEVIQKLKQGRNGKNITLAE